MTSEQENEDAPATPFNLVHRPWIPVLFRDGTTGEVSLSEIFTQAQSISQVIAELPTVGVAIEGVLQAILRRSVGALKSEDSILVADFVKDAWFDWDAVGVTVNQYLSRWVTRFDLFDPVAPFYQVAGLEPQNGKVAGLELLLSDVPNGTPFLTMRRGESLSAISFAESARWLVHAQAYDPSGIRGAAVGDRRASKGKVYPTGPGWTSWFGAITPRTGHLSRDLLLASAPTGVGRLEFDPSKDLPVWERPANTERPEGIDDQAWETLSVKDLRELRRVPRGPADILTWQARRIRLIPHNEQVVGLVLAAGDPIDPQNRYNVEPRSSWRYSKPQSTKLKTEVYMPKEFRESNTFWRGVESLFPRSVTTLQPNRKTEVLAYRGPAVSSWIAILDDDEVLGDQNLGAIPFEIVGMVLGSNNSVVDDVVSDSLTLPAALLREQNRRYRVEVEGWVRVAEKIASAVAGFAADLARASGSDSTDGVFAESKSLFLADARTPFLATLSALELDSFAGAQRLGEQWREELFTLAMNQRNVLLNQVSGAAIIGCRVGDRYLTAGRAERNLLARVRSLLGELDNTRNPNQETETDIEPLAS